MTALPWIFVWAMFTLNPVTLTVWPGYAQMRPATFVFVMLTPRDEGNREACFGYAGDAESRSICWTMNGANERRSWRFEWAVRSSGEYVASATVRRIVDGRMREFTDSHPFRVIGME